LNKKFNLKGYSMAYDVFSKFKGSSSKIIKNIKVPMFYITGEKDLNSTPLMSKNLAKLTKSNYVIIKNARHILQLTHSTKFNFHLNQFIKSLK
jgi:pimeloyl-ACP methyl ester carboxylesterase